MATFNIGGRSVDSGDPDFAQNVESAVNASGGTVSGSIVAGDSHGHSGGVLNGDVVTGSSGPCRECGWHE